MLEFPGVEMRVLLISDIHANLAALTAVLKDAATWDRVWCLGDVVSYGPYPNECVEKIAALDSLCLPGNHDWAVLGKLAVDNFNPYALEAVLWTRDQLHPLNRAYLDQLVERVPPQFSRYTLVHASPRHPVWEYIDSISRAQANFAEFETPICFVGHTHIPMVYRQDPLEGTVKEKLPVSTPFRLGRQKMIVNPGSVGQPRDGDPRAAYAILDTETDELTHRRVEYDITATQQAMDAAHLPYQLVTRLSFGR
jgi:diadenosine tetraphosphatase ApaH/serine/threonine PP2A family protein phosphatase